MSLLTQTNPGPTGANPGDMVEAGDDAVAIEGLKAAFDAQRQAFAQNRYPTIDERRERLNAFIGMLVSNRKRISDALASDFGAHPQGQADLVEMLGPVARAQYVLENLEGWMATQERAADPALLGSASAYVRHEPKGVIGNIVPWNFPFDIGFGPLTEMLAAGNRVIVKPSEFTPACGELSAEMVKAMFDPAVVHVVLGGMELSKAFSSTPFDHLLYTGSPDVGRQVMAAAAVNLTPVTLELGGKCPVVMTPGSVTPRNMDVVMGTKTLKNGQMCVSVDYALVPRDEVETFVNEAKGFFSRHVPEYASSDDCTGIISDRHLERLTGMLAEAVEHEAQVIALQDGMSVNHETRQMPMSLVIDPPSDLRVMKEEIFGPIMPVVPYDDLDEALARINAGERPLGLYVFGDDGSMVDRVIDETSSGGVSVNACALQAALGSLPFGGSGNSGMGRHHGVEGFREFSNPRGVFKRGDQQDYVAAFFAPFSTAANLVDDALST